MLKFYFPMHEICHFVSSKYASLPYLLWARWLPLPSKGETGVRKKHQCHETKTIARARRRASYTERRQSEEERFNGREGGRREGKRWGRREGERGGRKRRRKKNSALRYEYVWSLLNFFFIVKKERERNWGLDLFRVSPISPSGYFVGTALARPGSLSSQ